jgi:hypothetical protein
MFAHQIADRIKKNCTWLYRFTASIRLPLRS